MNMRSMPYHSHLRRTIHASKPCKMFTDDMIALEAFNTIGRQKVQQQVSCVLQDSGVLVAREEPGP